VAAITKTQVPIVTKVPQSLNVTQIYLEKRLKVIPPLGRSSDNDLLVGTIDKNLESLGYVISPTLFKALSRLTESQLSDFYAEVVPVLKTMRGAHRAFRPMYPNFPQQVMDMSEFELYSNAIRHYWTFWLKDLGLIDDTWLPTYEKKERLPLAEPVKLDTIELGDINDFESIFTSLVQAKSSISASDKEIVLSFIAYYQNDIVRLLPETISHKEQLAVVASGMISFTTSAKILEKYVKTPTDVLRLAAALCGGDVSLADTTKFIKIPRGKRKFLLGLLESCKTSLAEEMVKYDERWIRLGEVLHPGDYKKQFPVTFAAFSKLRDNVKIVTFNSKVEKSLLEGDLKESVELLRTRPGDFARRLDHIFRLASSDKERKKLLGCFSDVASKVSTPVLLQVFTHFKERNQNDFHAVFPKGNLAKIKVLDTAPIPLNQTFCDSVVKEARDVLVARFSELEPLGNVYLDDALKNYKVPFSQRSASKALKTLVRGSKIPLDGDYDTIRFFVWWKNGESRTDIDLTATILGEDFERITDIAYYNLKDMGGAHSGDITNAPNGAAEFIDIPMSNVMEQNGRYIVMSVRCYTGQPYHDLPECFAGWMGRKKPNSGEIFEARTVKNKIDITADTAVALPLLIDVKERQVVWLDLSMKSNPNFVNAAVANSKSTSLVCKAMCKLVKPNLFDLLSMHAEGRGKLVNKSEKADVVFSAETTPFETDMILSKYL